MQIEEEQETSTFKARTPLPDQEHQVRKENPSFTNPAMLRKESTKVGKYRHKIIEQALKFGQYAVAVSYLYIKLLLSYQKS